MGGILFSSVGSGGERIISDAYINFKNLRRTENYFCAVNTSEKDHERVKLGFKSRRLRRYPNFLMRTIGKEDLGGYGAGKDKSLGLRAYRADKDKVLNDLNKLHKERRFKIAFTLATLGGGCGSLTLSELSNDIMNELGLRVVPICTIPFRREGALLINNALDGLKSISKSGLNPLIYDNERMMMFSDSVKEGVEMVNRNISLLISNLVDLVEYGDFATPPIDIIDITRLITPQCGTFSVVYDDNVKKFRKEWKKRLLFNLSLESKTIEKSKAFVLFKSRVFPHKLTEEVILFLRTEYKVTELIPTIMENRFAGYNIMALIWGLGIDDISPKLEPKKTLIEKISFWRK